MPNQYFQFKQFTVNQECCAMKVGTDGVLLGSWADVKDASRVLDIGTGTGLLALMIAQRNDSAVIDALEIDPDAVAQASANARNSPWSDRISVIQGDFTAMDYSHAYDLIVCNPPYFTNSLKCPDLKRSAARHSDSLPLDKLAAGVVKVLSESGIFAVVLPVEEGRVLAEDCSRRGLRVRRISYVFAKTESLEPKRVLIEFSFDALETAEERLVIEKADRHDYTDQYKALTSAFYLKF